MAFANNITLGRVVHTSHVTNLAAIVQDGWVSCPEDRKPDFWEIYSPEIMARRAQIALPFDSLMLGRCVSCLLTPKSAALFAVATGYGVARVRNSELVHLETSCPTLGANAVNLAISDRNALARDARVTPGTDQLPALDWEVIMSGKFSRDPADPTRAARAAAEVLVRDRIPLRSIERIVCWDSAVALTVADKVHELNIEVVVDRSYFFEAGR